MRFRELVQFYTQRWPSIVLIVTFLVFISSSLGQAQAKSIVWSDPIKLSSDEEILYPSVAVDPHGGVHVFWAQGAEPGVPPDAIVAVHWDGTSWSTPNDILAAPLGSGLIYDMPRVVSSQDGRLYLVWVSAGTVYFSWAWAAMSANTQAWSAPTEAAKLNLAHLPQVAVDNLGTIHLVVTDRKPGGSVIYVQSTDNGLTWTQPLEISVMDSLSAATPDHPQLVIDNMGILHVFWAANYPPEYLGREIYHVRSVDGGISWSLPTQLSFSDTHEDWDAIPVVTVDAQDRLHLVWVCGNVSRCYRWSQDHGATWSDTQQLFAPLLGSAGWDAMAADPYGSVYWVGALRYPTAVYAASYQQESWEEPPLPVITGPEWGGLSEAHRPQLAIGLGNKLNLVMVEGDAGPVYYMVGTTSGAATEPQPLPLPTPTESAMVGSILTVGTDDSTNTGATSPMISAALSQGNQAVPPTYSSAYPISSPAKTPFNSTAVSAVVVTLMIAAVVITVLQRKGSW